MELVQIDIGSISYLISEFFHLKLGASRCLVLNMLSASSMGPAVMEEGRSWATGFLFSSLTSCGISSLVVIIVILASFFS